MSGASPQRRVGSQLRLGRGALPPAAPWQTPPSPASRRRLMSDRRCGHLFRAAPRTSPTERAPALRRGKPVFVAYADRRADGWPVPGGVGAGGLAVSLPQPLANTCRDVHLARTRDLAASPAEARFHGRAHPGAVPAIGGRFPGWFPHASPSSRSASATWRGYAASTPRWAGRWRSKPRTSAPSSSAAPYWRCSPGAGHRPLSETCSVVAHASGPAGRRPALRGGTVSHVDRSAAARSRRWRRIAQR
jgi:hypothetical protein